MGKPVVFKRGEDVGEVEQLLLASMEDRLDTKRQKRRGVERERRIYRNYMSVLIELYRQHNTVESIPIFLKVFSLLVTSGLFFPRSAGGCGS